MSSPINYQYFIGIDIAKSSFVVATSSDKQILKFANSEEGFDKFYQTFQSFIPDALVILETTGKYELALVRYLIAKKARVHRAHALQVKNFIRSLGKRTKTDKVDSKALVLYGQERCKSLELYTTKDSTLEALQINVLRRDDLVKIQAQEKNRLKAPENQEVKESIEELLRYLAKEIKKIDQKISDLLDSNTTLKQQAEVAQSLPGIGQILSSA